MVHLDKTYEILRPIRLHKPFLCVCMCVCGITHLNALKGHKSRSRLSEDRIKASFPREDYGYELSVHRLKNEWQFDDKNIYVYFKRPLLFL